MNDKEKPIVRELSEREMDLLCNAYDESTGEFDLSKLPSGLQMLVIGYIDYAKEVIINRALPALDGLKPVHRRILITLAEEKGKDKMKCARIAGNVLKYHPHGDAPVYDAMVRMTHLNGTLEIPLVEGQGAFGHVYTDEKPADARYTEAKLHQNAREFYFTALDGIKYVPTFDGKGTEPETLSTNFPIILCNSTQGIAVGFSCSLPSFNFNDVIDLAIECIDDGECHTTIYPDFVTGGYYIKNDRELAKIMQTGKGRIKLRSRVSTSGKLIKVSEIPFGNTVQSLMKQINEKDYQWVKGVSDYCDFDGLDLTIECSSKNRVDEVLYSLYRDTGLQDTFPVDMTIILDGKPTRLGVWDIVKLWLEKRKEELTKHYEIELAGLEKQSEQARALIEVLKFPEKRDKIVDLVVHDSDKSAIDYILKEFDYLNLDYDTAKWLAKRRVSEFRDGGKYITTAQAVLNRIEEVKAKLADISIEVRKELVALKSKYGHLHPRKTEITAVDYEFVKQGSADVSIDDTDCLYTIKDGFLKKERYYGQLASIDKNTQILASASDTLIGIDNEGRVLRVYCEHLPYTGASELGEYLPKYFGFEDIEDYKIMHMWRLDGETKLLVYNDGYVGFLDTSEWIDTQRQVKVVEKGVSPLAGKLGYVGDVCSALVVTDTEGRIGWQPISSVKVKYRTARTKVFQPSKNATLELIAPLSESQIVTFFSSMGSYCVEKLIYLDSLEDITGDRTLFEDLVI